VNLLLLDREELRSDGTCAVSDRRAHHLRTVLGVEVGSTVRAGIVGGSLGTAEVLATDGDVSLRFTASGVIPAPAPVELVLAIPRPKVITRTIEIAASFAVGRIELTNAWRVDKSYLGSPRLEPGALALAARFGAEQGATTHIPEIRVHERLMGLLDTRFAAPAGLRLLAHPGAPPIESAVSSVQPTVLAIGPEGGWIERELDTFIARGFVPVSIGAPILRVEAAVASALGQLALLHRMRA
jgi:RsmE family RNA methyltransferase